MAKWLGAPLIGAFLVEMLMVDLGPVSAHFRGFAGAPRRKSRGDWPLAFPELCVALRGDFHLDSGGGARRGGFSKEGILKGRS